MKDTPVYFRTARIFGLFAATMLVAVAPVFAQPKQPAPMPKQPAPMPKPPAPPADPVAESLANAKPLMTPTALANLEKEARKGDYSLLILKGNMAGPAADIIEKGIKYRLYVMTLNDPRSIRKIRLHRDKLLADIRGAASGLRGNPLAAEAFRRFFLKTIVKYAKEPLENHLFARLAVATLIADLKLETSRGGFAPFPPAGDLLLKILNSDKQPWKVKVHAARGLGWVLQAERLQPELRKDIVDGLIKELGNSKYHYWYQARLAEALTHDTIVRRGGKMQVLDALRGAMNDKKRHWEARAAMAKALGRAKMDPAVDASRIAVEVISLLKEMIAANRLKPKQGFWKHSFMNMYLAFKPAKGERQPQPGLITKVGGEIAIRHSNVIQEAFKHVVEPVKFFIQQKGANLPVPAATENAVNAWLAKQPAAGAAIGPMSNNVVRKPGD